jgi:predicted ester cyclase
MDSPTASNRERVRAFYGLLGQPEEALLRISPGTIQHPSGVPAPWVGRERFRQHLLMVSTQFTEFRFDGEELVAEGDFVAVRYTMHGTSRSLQKLELPGMDFLRLKDGLIEEVWGIFDSAALMAQMGR